MGIHENVLTIRYKLYQKKLFLKSFRYKINESPHVDWLHEGTRFYDLY